MPVRLQNAPKVRKATSVEWPTIARPSRSLGSRIGPSARTAMVEGDALNIMNTPTGAVCGGCAATTSISELTSP